MSDERPEAVQRYLKRAVTDEARAITSVTVALQGRLRLKDTWYDFTSTLQVDALRAFCWRASVRRGLVRFRGLDRYQDGRGEMIWRLFGLLPVVRASDEDVTRSARGRAALEQVFLPAALARPEVRWSLTDDGWLRAAWALDGHPVAIELSVGPDGQLRAVRSSRWSDAAGMPWRHVPFGGTLQGEVRHAGLAVPESVSVGWFHGEPREAEARFFEATVTDLWVGG